jgi:hypothetical protein
VLASGSRPYTLGRSSGIRVRGSFPADLPVTAMSEPPKDPEYVLRGVAGVVFGRSYHLLAPTTVGRFPGCDIYLNGQWISRQHARLRPRDYGVEVEDLASTNGTFLNGQRVAMGIASVGDEIAFDQLRFRVDAVLPHRQSSGEAVRTGTAGRRRRELWLAAAIVLAAGALAAWTSWQGWYAG